MTDWCRSCGEDLTDGHLCLSDGERAFLDQLSAIRSVTVVYSRDRDGRLSASRVEPWDGEVAK